MFLQSAGGIIIDRLWKPTRQSVPWHDKLHWYIGRALFVLSLINIPLGMVLMGDVSVSIWVLLAIWYLILIAMFAWMESKRRSQQIAI
jgi:hypothetical protein